MASITANIEKELYKIEIKTPTGNILYADEPIEKGGQDKGFSPRELLASSLAACTCATVRMYADRKTWDLEKVKASIELIEEDGQTKFTRKLEFIGKLDETQRKRLLAVANACPIHKMLTGTIAIETILT